MTLTTYEYLPLVECAKTSLRKTLQMSQLIEVLHAAPASLYLTVYKHFTDPKRNHRSSPEQSLAALGAWHTRLYKIEH
jgi:hypothetical protein